MEKAPGPSSLLGEDGQNNPVPEGQNGEGGADPASKKPPKNKGKRRGSTGADDGGEAKPAVPKHNKKVANKITALTSKSTDIRCLDTLISGSNLL